MSERIGENPEIFKESGIITVPAVESLLDPQMATETWPEEVTTNKAFIEQTEKRRKIIATLDEVIGWMPHPLQTVEEAIESGQVNETLAESLYHSLSNLLEDEDYRRLLLYLPFEYIPQKSWHPSGEFLQQAIDRFRSVYLSAWRELLTTEDVRANFVDGDVIEIEERGDDLPRVVKAAHLSPFLIQKGLIGMSEVISLLEGSQDQTLRNSIADAIPVAADLGLVTEEDIKRMQASNDEMLKNLAQTINAEKSATTSMEESTKENIDFSLIQRELAESDIRSEAQIPDNISENRRKWLQGTLLQKKIDKTSNLISQAIQNNSFFLTNAAEFINNDVGDEPRVVLAEGIRKAIESMAANNVEKARELYENYAEILDTIFASDDSITRQHSARILRRLFGLGIVSADKLEQYGVTVPKLDRPVSENIGQMSPELQQIGTEFIANLETRAPSIVYPLALIYGSRLMGYGEEGSDLDRAIFIKPGTPIQKGQEIRDLAPDSIEFWLEEDDDQYRIHDFPTATNQYGASYWTHLLFGGLWVGDKQAVRELQQKLLTPYLYETDEQIYGLNARRVWLEQMEIGALQFRLMHKGYKRFMPSFGGVDTPNADKIDGQSAFWDSGYRRTATRLFARRVFLPKLPK